MKYFELFDLEPRLNLDTAALERKFHALSREHHPDFHTRAAPEAQARALETTALLNDAYRTLRDAGRRTEYLVRSHGLEIDSGQAPASMLMEVFEINEGLDELRAARRSGSAADVLLEKADAIRGRIADKRRTHDEALGRASERWDALIGADASEEERRDHLRTLAEIVAQSSYIRNLERELDEEAPR